MTDEPNRPNRSVNSSKQSNDQMTQSDWEELATEPDNTTDLGYELVDWEQFETLDDTDQLIFLPQDETQLADAAFIVADNSSLVDPTDRC